MGTLLHLRASRKGATGQTLVEFALILPIFLTILFGVIDGGRFVFTDSILSQAAREGARLGAVEASWIGKTDTSCGQSAGPVCPANVATLVSHITTAANRMVAGLGGSVTSVELRCDAPGGAPPAVPWAEPGPTTTCANNAQGNLLSVRLKFTYRPITPLAGPLIGTVERTTAATMVIN
jgi:Flp pilus assembly protein TadG